MTLSDPLFYTTILDNMEDGVVSIGHDGRIVTFNAAASRILGLAESEAVGAIVGEVLVTLEGLDDFTQAILDAVRTREAAGRKTVEIRVDGQPRLLSVTISYPVRESGGDRLIGLIAVFSDITEIRELRDTQIRLDEQVKEQYEELQSAYRLIEERNSELVQTLKRGRMVRAVAVAAVASILAGTGLFVWDRDPADVAPQLAEIEPGAPRRTVTVEPRALRTTISLPGRLVARQETHVVSPIDGRVGAIHFRYGDEVENEQLLVTLDTSLVLQEQRALRANLINADRRLKELENWDDGRDMAAARRTLSRARSALENREREVEQTELLLDKGIIPASEHEAALDALQNARLDHDASRQDLLAVQEEGSAAAVEIARLEHRNLADQLEELEASIERAAVRAPLAGVVMERPSSGAGFVLDGGRLLEGEEVTRGTPLLTIADVTSFAVVGAVDEVEIVKLRVGQPATVTSDAFPGVELESIVTSVSAQAVNAGAGSIEPAMFGLAAAVREVPPRVRPLLRLGMSADLRIVTRDEPAVLLVPIGAVRAEPDGSYSVRLLDPATDEVRRVAVEPGATTQDAVELLSGIAAGDRLVVGAGSLEP